MDPVEEAVHPWLERHTSSNSSQKGPGVICNGCALVGPTLWINMIVVFLQPHGERSYSFCFRGYAPLAGYALLAVSYRGTQDLSAGAVSSESL